MPIIFNDIEADPVFMRDREREFLKNYSDDELVQLKAATAKKQLERDLVEVHDLDLTNSDDLAALNTIANDYADRLILALSIYQLYLAFDGEARTTGNVDRATFWHKEYEKRRRGFSSLRKDRSRGGRRMVIMTRLH